MCHLSLCCCCINLRIGSLIIGWLGLVGGFLQLLDSTQAGYARIIKCVALILIYAALLYGIYSHKPTWMLFSIIFSAITICCFVILAIVAMVLIASDKTDVKKEDQAFVIGYIAAIYTIVSALGIYFTSVLYSYYKELKIGGIRSVA